MQAFVSGAGLGPITQSLAISFGVFVIALIDRSGPDYFGKRVATVLVEVCWILFSIALTSGAIWLFGDVPALLPVIGIGIDLEIAAAVGFLKEFGSKDYASRSRIAYQLLIACLYVVLGTWPAFIWTADPLLDALLVLAMIMLFELFFRGDAQGPKAIPSRAGTLAIRGFDIGTCCWLAVLAFQGLESIPGSNNAISMTIAMLVGIVLLFIPLQPFKKGGLLKQVYWSAFSIACGTLTTTVSYNYAFAPVYVHFLFGGLVFFLLFRVILERKDRSATGKFLLNLVYYAVIYATVTGILF
ncbi:MAG: hypothetical protein GYA24_19510 [Candidatus Lokiarchaeota archaeon]|nr:hypothetical protein [Candidatus Lokiarchaeota archaeon]